MLQVEGLGTIAKAELHCFSDTSSKAYGSCVYLPLNNTEGDVRSTLVFPKSWVAPFNVTTIPRLELQATVLSTGLAEFIKKEQHNIKISVYFYTDSQIVLGYIDNNVRKFHPF